MRASGKLSAKYLSTNTTDMNSNYMPTLKLTKLFHLLDIFSILLTSEPRELLSNSTMHLHTYWVENSESQAL